MSAPSPLAPEVSALLERERDIPAVSPWQRSRAVARARASLATPYVATTAASGAAPRTRWAAAAAAALVVSAAVGAAAYELHVRKASRPETRPEVVAPVGDVVARAPAAEPSAVAVGELVPRPMPAVDAPMSSRAEAVRAELRLLRQARVAVARGDFAAALSPIAEHARRFKNGRLAEEREALRVKALAGLGRMEEARHAAVAFRARFPRSVLLPAVSKMPAPAP